jgi:ferredoxin/flavodoxin---NADP+ reductase
VLRVAVVGSGPAGIYAAEALARSGRASVDVLDRLPTPFGLVRYGVAPDHSRTQSIATALAKVFEHPAVRFLGNVEVGTDLSPAELHQHYDAVVFATGAAVDRRLRIPGEELPGSLSATDFVAWYTGHPDAAPVELDARAVAVIGMGNVAGDVARVLARSPEDLTTSDVPDQVLEGFRSSTVEDIYLIGRRGPAEAKFTTRELRELGDLAHAEVLMDPRDLDLDERSRASLTTDRAARGNVEVFRAWAARPASGCPRRIHLRFMQRPVEILGESRVTGIRLERTRLDPAGVVRGTGETHDLDVEMVLRSVGYRGAPLPGVPFDDEAGVIHNDAGRVRRDGVVVPGEYVAGWIKRGPTGVIGTNKHDARETVRRLLEDEDALPAAPVRDPDAVLRLLADNGVTVVTWHGWGGIERAEAAVGRAQGRARAKIGDRPALLKAATEEPPAAD